MSDKKESVPTCPSCGYTKEDQFVNGDHYLCKNAGKAPWEIKVAEPKPSAAEQIVFTPRMNELLDKIIEPQKSAVELMAEALREIRDHSLTFDIDEIPCIAREALKAYEKEKAGVQK